MKNPNFTSVENHVIWELRLWIISNDSQKFPCSMSRFQKKSGRDRKIIPGKEHPISLTYFFLLLCLMPIIEIMRKKCKCGLMALCIWVPHEVKLPEASWEDRRGSVGQGEENKRIPCYFEGCIQFIKNTVKAFGVWHLHCHCYVGGWVRWQPSEHSLSTAGSWTTN